MVDRYVGGSCRQDGEDRGHLPHAPPQDNGDPVPHADVGQPRFQGLDVLRHLSVRVASTVVHQGDVARTVTDLLPECCVQRRSGMLGIRRPYPGAHVLHPAREANDVVGLPDGLVINQSVERLSEALPHVLKDRCRNGALSHIPVDTACPVVLQGLAVDPHLRGAADAVHELKRPVGLAPWAASQGTGEDHRDHDALTLGPPHLAQNLRSGEGGVRQLLGQLLLGSPDSVDEWSGVRTAGVDGDIREVSDDALDPGDAAVTAH